MGRSLSLSGSGFFIQSTPSRESLFRILHEIVFHGNGGYDWHTVYNMPIWLRNFTFQSIKDFIEKQNEAKAKAQGKQTAAPAKGPNLRPNFTTKKTQ